MFFGPRCLCQIFVTVGGVLVLVEEKSTARKQNFVRSPQVAMRPFSAANAVHTRRKFSTVRDHLDRLGVETSIFGAWWKNLPNLDKAQFSEIWTRLIPHRSRMTVHFFVCEPCSKILPNQKTIISRNPSL